MSVPLMPKRKAEAISNGIFLILLGILFYTNAWWPGILVAIGATFALRQYLTGRFIDFLITLGVLAVIVVITFAGLAFSILMPLLFVLGGLYLIMREYLFREGTRLHWRQDIDDGSTKNGPS